MTGAIIAISATNQTRVVDLMERRGCKFMAPIHTRTWRDDAQQQTKFRFWIRSCNDEKSHWRRRGGVIWIASPCSRIVVVPLPGRKEFAESRHAAKHAGAYLDHPRSAERSISVRPDRSVDRLAAQIPGGRRCQ